MFTQLRNWLAGGFTSQLTDALRPIHGKLDVLERQNRNLTRQLLTPPNHMWREAPGPHPEPEPAEMIFAQGQLCRAQSFRQPYFSYWAAELHERLRYHRKLWEFVFVCQALYERGLILPGRRGLGFGVGTEPLSAYFASKGCEIVGTDMDVEAAIEAGWTESPQHATGLAHMARPAMIPMEVFESRVRFRVVDMNEVPTDLTNFDFCWSACAFEHLGTIERGLAFVERSIQTLKVGGYAVHTSEYNLTSNEDTICEGPTVLFRRRDFEALARRVADAGHQITPIDFHPGYGHVDRHIDTPPFNEDLHLKVQMDGWAFTSIGFVIRRMH